ncbi:hypothetical protein EJ08DRAFT_577730 [Tothia fuscella]|uniref:Cytochrome b5 heme-binding domain-containing protein n=1 Tax=Tothia fuscella TaxID=1048955 RepID=A0A9P4U4Y1_9PEZI|nr:hypothetical protein EJ08DRAFT_577730 [Tothia fuscella]
MFSFFRKSPAVKAVDDLGVSVNEEKEHQKRERDSNLISEAHKTRERTPEIKKSADLSPDATPKPEPVAKRILPPVPSFSLSNGDSDDDSEDEGDNAAPPSFPAVNSAQRASAPKSSLKTTSLQAPTNGFIKPPVPQFTAPSPRLPQPLRTPPSLAAGLRVPTTGPLPNRGPPTKPTAGGLAVPPGSIATSIPNPRKKVLLKPGHSPLDWAHLQKSSANLSGVDRLQRVTPTMLKHFNGRKGRPAWSSYQGKVYNITPYIPFHPGGEGELKRAAGKDGGKLFMEVHPWVNWDNMLNECLVGIMIGENEGVERGGGLDEMD